MQGQPGPDFATGEKLLYQEVESEKTQRSEACWLQKSREYMEGNSWLPYKPAIRRIKLPEKLTDSLIGRSQTSPT